ncbi:PQQ-dependent sugar dehydrogenase [Hymenobacter latericus]|uniref:PQQ-dependent sugar dehydrogenase n=1 Tax=Hymenobacter sp. YIM 151858-1 TaxID=2987688 RepID=UPI00222716C1|nr:PQQ-dependent sugar dehydrogenase [Hymenobacter sp. YIM 151858-1]UYZ59904.1 PQQ-dependent sugar dehydrogenase [Hymenobacter sp. YIM 151858-1]
MNDFTPTPRVFLPLALLLATALSGCYKLRGHYGGTQTFEPLARRVEATDVAVPAGYRVEAVAQGLTYPTGIAFDERGTPYVLEAGYSYGEVWTAPRLLRLEAGGRTSEVYVGGKNGPWTGVTYHDGNFYISEGGQLEGGRILRVSPQGQMSVVVDKLPSYGDHHTNMPLVGPDGYLYFGQGTATNSGVVGPDNADYGWLTRRREFHDIPCQDITLTGENFQSDNPLTEAKDDKITTGAYVPFGTATTQGQVIKGQLPCTGAIMRVSLRGGTPELVAWGLRNPFGLAYSPDGRLFTTENAYDTRGSRPGYGCGDVLWEIKPGAWYGFPDYSAGQPMNTSDYETPKRDPKFLLAKHPQQPPKPAAILGVHSSSNGFDFSRAAAFGHVGEAFVAQFGDMAPEVGRVYGPVGYKVVRVNPATGAVEDFVVNKGRTNGPASEIGSAGLERPVAARFDPTGSALYVVDFGVMPMTEQGPSPRKQTGVVWKITKQ